MSLATLVLVVTSAACDEACTALLTGVICSVGFTDGGTCESTEAVELEPAAGLASGELTGIASLLSSLEPFEGLGSDLLTEIWLLSDTVALATGSAGEGACCVELVGTGVAGFVCALLVVAVEPSEGKVARVSADGGFIGFDAGAGLLCSAIDVKVPFCSDYPSSDTLRQADT